MTLRDRFIQAVDGEKIEKPIYAVYDAFVRNKTINWDRFFKMGLAQINHAVLISAEYPHLEITETKRKEDKVYRTDYTWATDKGELHQYYIGDPEQGISNWCGEHLIKKPEDYLIMKRALEDAKFRLDDSIFMESEKSLAGEGITLGQLGRTPLQKIQIDFAGLERFSIDFAMQQPELFELIEMLNEQKLEEFRLVTSSKAEIIKLWENLSIETMGPQIYRQQLVPLYKKIFDILDGSGKQVIVHYDGNTRLIAEDIHDLPFGGIDSLTPPPEGDMDIEEARRFWPDKFLWIHPTMSWFQMPEEGLKEKINETIHAAAGKKYCLMISEDIPPNWEKTIPWVLEACSKV